MNDLRRQQSRRLVRAATAMLVSGAAATLALAAAGGVGVPALSQPAVAATRAPVAPAAAKAPCIPTGSTLHADEQMAARGITTDEVENAMHFACMRGYFRSDTQTWQYVCGGLQVAANDNGYVVTVIRLA